MMDKNDEFKDIPFFSAPEEEKNRDKITLMISCDRLYGSVALSLGPNNAPVRRTVSSYVSTRDGSKNANKQVTRRWIKNQR